MSAADTGSGMGAVALETAHRFDQRLSAVEPWEVHSELALVSQEVYERARELLPERDPDAFLARLSDAPFRAGATFAPSRSAGGLATALVEYTLWRVVETARSALVVLGAVVALASLAELLR
jgi:hypothetical protein